MAVGIGSGCVVLSVGIDNQQQVIAVKLTQEIAVSVKVQTQDILIEPNLAAAQGRLTQRLESYALDLVTGQQITH